MKIKYIRDFRRNYLVIKKEDSGQDRYPVKMITENSIDGLVPCQERMINGESLLYYDITSRQNIQGILEVQPLQMQHLQKMFSGLRTISEVIEKYLLDPGDLLLLPEFVYMDMGTWEYSFIYYPGKEGEGNHSLRDLNEFFMQHMDSENVQLVEAVYQMADLLNRQQFVLDELITWFQENYDEERIEEQNETTIQTGWHQSQSIQGVVQNKRWNEDGQMDDGNSAVRETTTSYISIPEFEGKKSLWRRLKEWVFPNNKWEKKGHTTASSRYIRYQNITDQERVPELGSYEHTMFIPWVENSDNKLYGIGKNNKYHISLQKLPVTVGKMSGAVDIVLNDQSISRLHARISRDGNRFFITDLNSTNGTFRNGMRLEPNASEIIEPGDEIGIGKLKFIYR